MLCKANWRGYSLICFAEGRDRCAWSEWFPSLVLGRLGCILASETCALDIIGADFVRDVEPGEMVVISSQEFRATGLLKMRRLLRFVFFNIFILPVRTALLMVSRFMKCARKSELCWPGRISMMLIWLFRPHSIVPAAIGLLKRQDCHLSWGLSAITMSGRTFIEPTQKIRHLGVSSVNITPMVTVAWSKEKIVLVDDSIVRGQHRGNCRDDASGRSDWSSYADSSPPITHGCFTDWYAVAWWIIGI